MHCNFRKFSLKSHFRNRNMSAMDAFLRLGILVSILVSLVSRAHAAAITSNPKIVIIGAGPAGIAAGVKLLEYGFEDVTILEAESRIGGRVHTIPFADNVVDLGAQWCHGEENNVVYEMVKDRNVLGSSLEIHKNTTYNRSNGEKLPEEVRISLTRIMEAVMAQRSNESTLNYDGSRHDFMEAEFFKALAADEYKNIDPAIAAEFFENYLKEECSAEGSDDLTIIPLHGNFEESAGNQALNWKDNGYKELLRVLMKSRELGKEYGLLDGHIRLSKEVAHIEWQREDKKVLIHCLDGEEILADHVIVTVSIGVLKAQHSTLFKPALPVEKKAAIEEIGFGSVDKIFLEFDKKFWPEYWTGLSLLWTKEDLHAIRGTDSFWLEGVFGIFAVDYQPRVFEIWTLGPSARHMETLDEQEVKRSCVKLLERFLKWQIPEPVNMIRTTWYSNPHFRGSWSYHTIKMLKADISPRELERPLNVTLTDCVENNEDRESACEKPIVLFAGEASNSKHFSTVHGAVETGWREAERLANFYDVKTKL